MKFEKKRRTKMKKRTKCLFIIFALMLAMNLFVTGCQVSREDGEVKIRLNPKTAESIEKGGEAAVGIAKALAPFLGPAGGLLVGGLGSGLALFKKFKPKLTHFQTKAELSHTVADITVNTLEKLKKEHPEVWAKYGDRIHKELLEANIDTKVLKNFIRGLRGLPAKT
jgi:hypothetical protein